MIARTTEVTVNLTSRELADELLSKSPAEQVDFLLAISQRARNKVHPHILDEKVDNFGKEFGRLLNYEERRDVIMFFKYLLQTMKNEDEERKEE